MDRSCGKTLDTSIMPAALRTPFYELNSTARSDDMNSSEHMKENKRTSWMLSKDSSSYYWTSHGSHCEKENSLPEQGDLAYLGQAADTDCSYYEPGLRPVGIVEDDDSTLMFEGHPSARESLYHPEQDLLAGDGHEEPIFSHGPSSASMPAMWTSGSGSHLLYYPESEQSWSMHHHSAGSPHLAYIEEVERNAAVPSARDEPVHVGNASQCSQIDYAGDDNRSDSSRSNLSVRSIGEMSQNARQYNVQGPAKSPFATIADGFPQRGSQARTMLASQQSSYSGLDHRNTNMAITPTQSCGNTHANRSSRVLDEVDEPDTDQSRTHPLYAKAKPDEHGMYHCPFAAEQKCEHLPTKLKCNYDKFIDSHLKPHRCKAPDCENLRFSSTACRLRHEREAHGSHGHGYKPYLCLFEDCDRSRPGNGFPRSWNRNDHMKRVHGHISAPDAESQTSPKSVPEEPAGTGSSDVATVNTGRKRSGKPSARPEQSKKAKTSRQHSLPDDATQSAPKKGSKSKLVRMESQWRQQWANLHERIHGLRGPLDIAAIQALHEESAEFLSLSKEITRLDKLRNGDRRQR